MNEERFSGLIELTASEKQFISILKQFKEHHLKTSKESLVVLFCGGWVRDKILKIESKDLDLIMTDHLVPLFCQVLGKIGEQNQANVKIKNRIKLTNHNCNGMELVQVTFNDLRLDIRQFKVSGGLKEDLRTRDFRCNALFYDPLEDCVIDRVRGRTDVEARLLTCVESFERTFLTDFSRLIRVVRFKMTKDFQIPLEVEQRIRSLTALDILDAERRFLNCRENAYVEFKRVFQAEKCVPMFEEMARLQIFKAIFITRSISEPDIKRAILLMRKTEAFFASRFFQVNDFNQLEKLRKNMLFKYAFLFACAGNAESRVSSLAGIVLKEKTSAYILKVFAQFQDADRPLDIDQVSAEVERSFNFPHLVVIFDRTPLAEFAAEKFSSRDVYELLRKRATSSAPFPPPARDLAPALSAEEPNAGFRKAAFDRKQLLLIQLLTSMNLPRISEFTLKLLPDDFRDLSNKTVQNVIFNTLVTLQSTQAFSQDRFLKFYAEKLKNRTLLTAKDGVALDTFRFFVQSFKEFLSIPK